MLSSKISRLILCGNSVKYSRPNLKNFTFAGSKTQSVDTNEFLLKKFKRFVGNTCPFIDTDIIPGSEDPSSQVFPQRPMHKALVLDRGSDSSTVVCHTNPCHFSINGNIDVLGSAGQNVEDVCRYKQGVSVIDAAEYLLKISHIAPSAPDTLCIISYFFCSNY